MLLAHEKQGCRVSKVHQWSWKLGRSQQYLPSLLDKQVQRKVKDPPKKEKPMSREFYFRPLQVKGFSK